MVEKLELTRKHFSFLEKLSNALGVSGEEGEVRRLVLDELRDVSLEWKVDSIGNLLITRKGSSPRRLKVMVAAHMDEVGLMITQDLGEGLFRVETLGGIDPRHLPGKSFIIGKEHVPGVLGTRHVHLTTAQERKQTIPIDKIRLDAGPGKSNIQPGDRAAFSTRLKRIGPSLCGKALDDRLGVAVLVELVRSTFNNIDLLAAFTVQEETGLRGAKVAANHFKPDLAIVLDATPANDLPAYDGSENIIYNTHLGQGSAIYISDRGTISDPRLVRLVEAVAIKEDIPSQHRQPGSGGTDAGAIHKELGGIPSISISVPCRYLHSTASLVRVTDYLNQIELLKAVLKSIHPDLLTQERNP